MIVSICRTCSADCAATCWRLLSPFGTELMFSDLSIDGVLIPGLLAVAAAALALSMLTSRLLASLGLYRLFAARPLVGLSLFVILAELMIRLSPLLEK